MPPLLYAHRSRASVCAPRDDAETRPTISQRNSTGRSRTGSATSDSSKQSTTGFKSFGLRSELLRAVQDADYTSPRPIQVQAIPPALEGRDVLGLAQTGTGKTAAFVLPILQRLLEVRRQGQGARALVVAPTRELASQIEAEFERLARHTAINSTAVFGGVPIARQIRALKRSPQVVVACPGRLLDLLSQRALRLDDVEVLVLDEADHMFDMGFLPDIRRILKQLPRRRQNLLFSATMSREIRKLADTVLNRPAVVELAHSKPAETIEHALYTLAEGQKLSLLRKLLSGDDFRSAIVFTRTKRRAKRLAERLDKAGHAAVAMQGNMSQGQRERALLGFRENRFDVLVATDIAARGLDIENVSHVINFDVPNTPDAYTHRIGRTGRSEQTGVAFTFVTGADSDALRAIEKRLGSPIERRRATGLGTSEESLGSSKGGRSGRSGPQGGRRGGQKSGAKAATRSGPKAKSGRGARPGGDEAARGGPSQFSEQRSRRSSGGKRGRARLSGGRRKDAAQQSSGRTDRAGSSPARRSERQPAPAGAGFGAGVA